MIKPVTVNIDTDSCHYLELIIDLKGGKYHFYKCALKYSNHPCQKMGACPLDDTGDILFYTDDERCLCRIDEI